MLTNAGASNALRQATTGAATRQWIIRLAVNKFTPSRTIAIGNFIECSVPGYHRFGLNDPLSIIVDDGVAQATYSDFIINFLPYAGPLQVLYGWYVVPGNVPNVLGCQMFNSPITIPLVGVQQSFIALTRLRQRVFFS